MNDNIRKLLQRAARLPRAIRLQAATAAIQSLLRAQVKPAAASARPQAPRAGEAAAASPSVGARGQPGGAQRFEAGVHAEGAVRREYKLYVPPGAGREPLPLVVMLHGCTQNPDDFAAGTAMNEAALVQGFYVLYPAQSRQANPQGCWNWFKHTHQQRDRGEPALLAGMTRAMLAQHAIDPRRVYVAGLSAGGAMAAILGSAYPELFAAVGVHSGLAAGAATDLPSALAAMRVGASAQPVAHDVPTIVFHGDADATVHPANADQVAAAAAGAAATVQVDEVRRGNGTRSWTRRVHLDRQSGRVRAEHWLVHGAPHAWSGGSTRGSYTDSRGPDATAEMLRFFFENPRPPVQ